jgi:hypothetical protein
MSYNQFYNNPSYKHYPGPFKKDTNDYHVGKNGLEPWDKDSLTDYCIGNFEYILRNDDYTHVLIITKKFLKIFDCNYPFEFEENVLKPILRKLCIEYKQDFETVQKRIFENESISYKEDIN